MRNILTIEHLKKGCKIYHIKEKQDKNYVSASKLVSKGQYVDGCLRLLLTWNKAARVSELSYRNWLNQVVPTIRKMDKNCILSNFSKLCLRTGPSENKKIHLVATVKAIHILRNNLIPIWDNKIADRYHVWHNNHHRKGSIECFLQFVKDIDNEVKLLQSQNGIKSAINNCPTCSELNLKGTAAVYKLLDELNYMEWTYPQRSWISKRRWNKLR